MSVPSWPWRSSRALAGELRRALLDDDLGALTDVRGSASAPRSACSSSSSRAWRPDLDLADVPAGLAPAARADARAALTGLGYAADEVRAALDGLPDDGAVEDLVRDALKRLAVRGG